MNAAIAVRQAAEGARPKTDLRRARRILAGALEMAELMCLAQEIAEDLLDDLKRQIDRIVAGLEALPAAAEEWSEVPLPPLEEPSAKSVEETARPLRQIREQVRRLIQLRAVVRRGRAPTRPRNAKSNGDASSSGTPPDTPATSSA
jgi:hypothetical protein